MRGNRLGQKERLNGFSLNRDSTDPEDVLELRWFFRNITEVEGKGDFLCLPLPVMAADWSLEGFAKVYIVTLSALCELHTIFCPKDSSDALGFDGPSSKDCLCQSLDLLQSPLSSSAIDSTLAVSHVI